MRVADVVRPPSKLPAPQFGVPWRQLALEHIRDVLADNGEELEPMVRSNRSDIEALGIGMWADPEVDVLGHAVPSERAHGSIFLFDYAGGRKGQGR